MGPHGQTLSFSTLLFSTPGVLSNAPDQELRHVGTLPKSPKIEKMQKMTKIIEKNSQNAKKSNFFVRTSFPRTFCFSKTVFFFTGFEILAFDKHKVRGNEVLTKKIDFFAFWLFF